MEEVAFGSTTKISSTGVGYATLLWFGMPRFGTSVACILGGCEVANWLARKTCLLAAAAARAHGCSLHGSHNRRVKRIVAKATAITVRSIQMLRRLILQCLSFR
jgi:hypothetical protein